jgi:hypothetical protein
MVMP